MTSSSIRYRFAGVLLGLAVVSGLVCFAAEPAPGKPNPSVFNFPSERTTYFVGEVVPLDLGEGTEFRLEGVHANGTRLLYSGASPAILLDTARLATGDYALKVNGKEAGVLHMVTSARRSAGSMQDETSLHLPNPPQKLEPEALKAFREKQAQTVSDGVRASGVSCFVAMGAADVGQMEWLDVAARGGAMALANPDTRPTSFFPVGTDPRELNSMSQRLVLAAQANSRYPNFGGFCLGWDTTGYAIGNRRGLLTYWGWGNKTEALRKYLGAIDQQLCDEFQKRTGMAAVKESEYIAYLLAIKRPEFATAIDLPTRRWLHEIAAHTKPQGDAERAEFEKRLDAWSSFLMDRYREAYGTLSQQVKQFDPALRQTASVQVDHAPVRFGQYFPSAYEPLDLQYQSTWNDQVGGPDYAYQWLFTAGLLDMHRGGKQTWLSNTFGPVHARAEVPGKFVRVAGHGLAYGVSGIGFALEGFSNLFGGMNAHSRWDAVKGHAGGADVLAGKEFLDRFAALAVEGRGDHGVGILFSKSQYQRQHIAMGYGTAPYQAFVTLARLGYTPRFVTEEELTKQGDLKLKAILIAGQTFALPPPVVTAIEKFTADGGLLLVDGNTSVALTGAKKIEHAFAFSQLGKPHNWGVPNIPAGSNDALLAADWHRTLAPVLAAALGDSGRGLFTSEKGAEAQVSLMQIDAGRDAKYVVAVNDSMIKSQADWTQVREKLLPVKQGNPAFVGEWLFDCTEEKPLGRMAPIDCELSQTTARVYAVLAKPLAKMELSASQDLSAGETLTAAARFLDDKNMVISAVMPLVLSLARPDGEVAIQWYRSTDREGRFETAIPLPSNAPAGAWKLSIRSQLNGQVATLPIAVTAKEPTPSATAIEGVLVRERDLIEAALAKGARVVLPIFDSPAADKLMPVAEEVKKILAARGVEVEIQLRPQVGNYWLTYALDEPQMAENRRVEAGEVFGRIKRETTNHNDWFAAVSGWHYPRPLLLLDLAGETKDSPMAESLDAAGILWPKVTATFPGPKQAIVEGVAWAFSPKATTVVLRANDIEGLSAAAQSLARLPADRLMPPIRQVKNELWRGHHIGHSPALTPASGLTQRGLEIRQSSQPFAIKFLGPLPPAGPVARADVKPVVPVVVPAKFEPKQFSIQVRDGDQLVDSATAGMLVPDLRFSDAIKLVVEVKEPGKHRIVARGVFRYNDRKPCWQAQWEDIIELREKLVPKKRLPPAFAVLLAGQALGRMDKSQAAQVDVPLELASSSAGLKPKTVVEEVVTELSGEVTLPAGVHVLSIAQENIVDGKLDSIEIAR